MSNSRAAVGIGVTSRSPTSAGPVMATLVSIGSRSPRPAAVRLSVHRTATASRPSTVRRVSRHRLTKTDRSERSRSIASASDGRTNTGSSLWSGSPGRRGTRTSIRPGGPPEGRLRDRPCGSDWAQLAIGAMAAAINSALARPAATGAIGTATIDVLPSSIGSVGRGRTISRRGTSIPSSVPTPAAPAIGAATGGKNHARPKHSGAQSDVAAPRPESPSRRISSPVSRHAVRASQASRSVRPRSTRCSEMAAGASKSRTSSGPRGSSTGASVRS